MDVAGARQPRRRYRLVFRRLGMAGSGGSRPRHSQRIALSCHVRVGRLHDGPFRQVAVDGTA